MLIKEIVKKNLITCNINDGIYTLSRIMEEFDVGFIPIISEEKIVGVVTDRDIVIRGIAKDINDIELIMSKDPIEIDCNASIESALNLFYQYKIKRLLVMENGKCIGVLSINDLLRNNYNTDTLFNTLKELFSIEIQDNNPKVDEFNL